MSRDRWCCDGKCNDAQGRGGCPAIPKLKPAPMPPRWYEKPGERAVVGIALVMSAWLVIVLLWIVANWLEIV